MGLGTTYQNANGIRIIDDGATIIFDIDSKKFQTSFNANNKLSIDFITGLSSPLSNYQPLINSSNQISQAYRSGLSTTLSDYQIKNIIS